jgi:hypothetical protein
MALESKPLCHPEVLRQQVRSFNLPERVEGWQAKLQHWSGLIASGRADDFKETALLPDFLTDILGGLLDTIEPARALAVETLKLERTLIDLVNQAYGLTPAEIDLMWKTAPPRMPIPPPPI